MTKSITKLASLAGLILLTSTAQAFSPPLTFKSIAPVSGSEDLKLVFETMGTEITMMDDDGMATLVALDYHFANKRNVLYDEKGSANAKNLPVENYAVVQPLLLAQTQRLIKNYRQWYNEAKNTDAREAYEIFNQAADSLEAFLPKLKSSKMTNADMSEFSRLVRGAAEFHSYSGTVGGKAKMGLEIAKNGSNNPVGQAHGSLHSMCEAESVVKDLRALVAGAKGGASPGPNSQEPAGTAN